MTIFKSVTIGGKNTCCLLNTLARINNEYTYELMITTENEIYAEIY